MNSVTKCLQMEIFFDLFVTVLRVELSSTSTKKCFPVQAWVTRRRKREKGEIIFGFFVCNDRCRVNNGTTKADSNLALWGKPSKTNIVKFFLTLFKRPLTPPPRFEHVCCQFYERLLKKCVNVCRDKIRQNNA